MHEWIRWAFARMGIESELAPCCRKEVSGQCFVGAEKFDVLWKGRKIAGAAQRRNRCGLLIQGSVQPPPLPLRREDWERAMVEAASAEWGVRWSPLEPSAAFRAAIRQLSESKYARDEFNQRR
jgi:lipoate-protein ligase A